MEEGLAPLLNTSIINQKGESKRGETSKYVYREF